MLKQPIIYKISLSLILLFNLNACSWFADDSEFEPAELVDIKEALPIDKHWSSSVGKGSGEQLLGLSPFIQEGIAYIADYKGEITALDLKTGNKLWQKDLDLPFSGGPGGNDELLIIGTANGDVLALEKSTGKQLWQQKVSSEILSTPQLSSGIVIVRTVDGKIVALNSRDGAQQWEYQRDVPALSLRGTSNPIIDRGLVLAGMSGGKLVALDLENGRLLWEVVIAPPSGASELDRIADIDSDPLLSDGILYVASFQGKILAINGRVGTKQWQRNLATSQNMAIDNRALYLVNKKDEVYALDLDTGNSLWKNDKLLYRQLSAPTVFKNSIVVGDNEGYLHFLDKKTGQLIAREHADSDPILTQPIVVNNTLYIVSADGDMNAFDFETP